LSYLLDTSLVVAALTAEIYTAQAHDWLDLHRAEPLWISEWGLTECSAALSFKARTGQLSVEEQLLARDVLSRMVAETLGRILVTSLQFQLAGELAARVDTGLRAGDALHLATAMDVGATIVTLDTGMARAAEVLGISFDLVQRKR